MTVPMRIVMCVSVRVCYVYLYMISVNVIYCNFFSIYYYICLFISYAPFFFYRLNGGIHRIFFVYYSFRFHSFQKFDHKINHKICHLFFIYLSSLLFFLFGHSSKPSSFCTLLYRAYSQTHTIIHVHAHTRFLPILHTYNTFFRLHSIFLTLFRTLSLALSYFLLILLSLSYFIYLFRSKKSEQ